MASETKEVTHADLIAEMRKAEHAAFQAVGWGSMIAKNPDWLVQAPTVLSLLFAARPEVARLINASSPSVSSEGLEAMIEQGGLQGADRAIVEILGQEYGGGDYPRMAVANRIWNVLRRCGVIKEDVV